MGLADINYWLSRLRPLWKKEVDPHDESNSDSDDSDDGNAPSHQSTNEDSQSRPLSSFAIGAGMITASILNV